MKNQKQIEHYIFSGPLSNALERFIAEKRGMGNTYNAQARALFRFDKFTLNYICDKDVLSKELVEAWICKTPNESPNNQKLRVWLLQQLSRFMQRYGYEAYIPLSDIAKKSIGTYVPYIYNDTELAELFHQADLCKFQIQSPNKHLIIPLLLRILYGCGLRISEALNLKVKDIDLENGLLSIYGAKFDNDRLVPMATSLTERCRIYFRQVHSFSDPSAVFLPTPDNGVYKAQVIYREFRKLLWQAGISHGGKGHGPRIHDLRHAFSVHCLRSWVLSGVDISAAMPLLSAYLGHSNLQGTQHYLRLTADIFPHITELLEMKFGDCIPALGGDDVETD